MYIELSIYFFNNMKVILTEQCESFTGSIGQGFGYHIVRRKNGFFARRNSKGFVPRDGHWRFIIACAELAQQRLHIADICVSRKELARALNEARIGYLRMFRIRLKSVYNADDILLLSHD